MIYFLSFLDNEVCWIIEKIYFRLVIIDELVFRFESFDLNFNDFCELLIQIKLEYLINKLLTLGSNPEI